MGWAWGCGRDRALSRAGEQSHFGGAEIEARKTIGGKALARTRADRTILCADLSRQRQSELGPSIGSEGHGIGRTVDSVGPNASRASFRTSHPWPRTRSRPASHRV